MIYTVLNIYIYIYIYMHCALCYAKPGSSVPASLVYTPIWLIRLLFINTLGNWFLFVLVQYDS